MSGSGPLQVLWPAQDAGEVLAPDPAEARLAELYAYPDSGCWVRANMVSTLDGAAAGPDGRSGSVNTAADRRVFAVLRGLADVVLVGAGTVRTEGYGLPRPLAGLAPMRAGFGQEAVAALAVVTRTGDVPEQLLDGDHGAYVVTAESAGAPVIKGLRDRAGADRVVVAGEESVDLTAAVDELADRGLERVLCEGGPTLLADLVAGGELDELCLTWSPMLTGTDAPRIVSGPPAQMRFELAHLLHADGALIGRWRALAGTAENDPPRPAPA